MTIGPFLETLPTEFWVLTAAALGVVGTLLAGLLSLAASHLASASNDRRFEKQLAHDALEKSKDRAAELRRSVYLNASDQLIAVNAFLGGLATVDPTDKQALTQGLLAFMTATSRVSLVSTEETRLRVSELSDAYGAMFFELMAEASDAHLLQGDIKINRESYENLHLERLRLIAAMRDFNETTESKFKFDALVTSLDRTTPEIEAISAEYKLLAKKQNKALIAYGEKVGERMGGLAGILTEVSALLRKELDNEVDLERMKADSNVRLEKVKSAAAGLFRKFEEIGKLEEK